jgi:hypothetical protein
MTTFTIIHVVISLLGIFSGFMVLFGLIAGQRLPLCTAFFLAMTILTSVTGFFFPVHHVMPSHIVGIISLIVLVLAIYARYPRRLAGFWRILYVIFAMMALYLNVFVAIVQAFMKISPLKAMAPTQTEPTFKLTQFVVLLLFVILSIIATIKFRDKAASSVQS